MPNVPQRSFAAGEIAPVLYGRTDTAKYATALRRCRNMYVRASGGASKRPGTEYIATAKDSSYKARLIKFVFDITDAFLLEFGAGYIRFYRDGGQVVDPNNSPNAYEVTTPYAAADLDDLRVVQQGDVLTIVHQLYPPAELKRLGNTSWTYNAISFGPGIGAPTGLALSGGLVHVGLITTYAVTCVSATGEESVACGDVTIIAQAAASSPIGLTWDKNASAVSYNIYKRIPDTFSTSSIYGLLASVDNTLSSPSYTDNESITPDPSFQPPTDQSSTLFVGAGNYPSVVAYYQQRLVLAASINHPTRVWASQTGNYHNFNNHQGLGGLAAIQDDDMVQFDVVSDEIDTIEHLLGYGRLVIMTQGAEWIADGDQNGVLTPIAINLRPVSYNGANSLKPVKTDNRIVYVQSLSALVRDLQSVVQFGYYSFQGSDLTVYSPHLFESYTLTDWDWQGVPVRVVWAVRSDGTMVGLTYVPEQEIWAWHRTDTKGFVERVCVIPEDGQYYVYWLVRRLIQGAYVRYIERQTTAIQNPVFATLEDITVTGGVNTPPIVIPPLPTDGFIAAPTNPSTSDITSSGATANWVAGNITAGSTVQIRLTGQSAETDWVSHTVAAGQQSFAFTGLSSGVSYEWRVQHFVGVETSAFLGPVTGTQFTTIFVTPTLTDPAAAPTLTVTDQQTGVTRVTVQWLASSQGANAEVQIAGPTSITPTDGEFSDIAANGTFIPGQTGALWQITSSGDYWLRVKYVEAGFNDSNYVTSSSVPVTVL